MSDVSQADVLGGPLLRVLVALAGPPVAQNFALVAQSVVDPFWAVRPPVAVAGAVVTDSGVDAAFRAVTLSNAAAAVWLAGYSHHSTGRGMPERAAGESANPAD